MKSVDSFSIVEIDRKKVEPPVVLTLHPYFAAEQPITVGLPLYLSWPSDTPFIIPKVVCLFKYSYATLRQPGILYTSILAPLLPLFK